MKKLLVFFALFVFPAQGMMSNLTTDSENILTIGDIVSVNTPIASMWIEPLTSDYKIPGALPLVDVDIPFHDTQLLYNEQLTILEQQGDWLNVEANEQPNYKGIQQAWGFCQGWVKREDVTKSHLIDPNIVVCTSWATIYATPNKDDSSIFTQVSLGTMLHGKPIDLEWWLVNLLDGTNGFIRADDISVLKDLEYIDQTKLRKRLVSLTKLFLGSPYCWGGRSAWKNDSEELLSSVDCSGLVNLVYRACGLITPRNSHPQFIASTEVRPCDLQPGDLIFLKFKKYNFSRVTHVLMYIGDDTMIESTENIKGVHKVRAQKYFGAPLSELQNGDIIRSDNPCGDFEIHCGSLLK